MTFRSSDLLGNMQQAKRHLRRKRRQARRQIVTLSLRAKDLGFSPTQFVFFRLKANLQRFVEGSPFNVCVALLIILSVFLIFSEFLIAPSSLRDHVEGLNDTITWMFILELTLRFFVAPNKRIFFSNYWIDILAVLPILRIFRTLRLLRLLRLLRVARAVIILLRQSGWLSLRLERHFGSFGVLFVTTVMLIVCGTLALLSFDPTIDNTQSAIELFLDKIWQTTFLFISGEMVGEMPSTPAGKGVAALISIAGLVIFAIMVGTISASMTAYFKTKMDAKDMDINDLNGHLIICGWDRMGGIVLSEIEAVPDVWSKGVVVVAQTDTDIARAGRIENSRRLFHVKKDFTKIEVLEEVGAKRAASAIVLADKGEGLRDQDRDARTVLAALTLEKLNPGIFTVAELLDGQNATHLHIAGVEEIISRTNLTAGLFASNVLSHGITSVINDILTHKQGSYLKKVPVPQELHGQPFIDAFDYFKREYEATILAIDSENDSGTPTQKINPPHTQILKSSDLLVLVLHKDSPMCAITA